MFRDFVRVGVDGARLATLRMTVPLEVDGEGAFGDSEDGEIAEISASAYRRSVNLSFGRFNREKSLLTSE